MLGVIFTIILTIIIGVVQVSLMPQLGFWGIFPDLALILLMSLVVNDRWETSFWMALGAGVIIDLSSANTFGVYTVSTIVALFSILALKKIIGTRYSVVIQWIIIGLTGTLIHILLIYALSAGFALVGLSSLALPSFDSFLRYMLPSAALTVILFTLLMPLLTRIVEGWKLFRATKSFVQNTK
ncbi:rod shape-determining protein MreD [Patescibacteria group bacterium]